MHGLQSGILAEALIFLVVFGCLQFIGDTEMRLTDEQLHEVLAQTYPKLRSKNDLMSAMMDAGSIFIITPHEKYAFLKRTTYPRWERVFV